MYERYRWFCDLSYNNKPNIAVDYARKTSYDPNVTWKFGVNVRVQITISSIQIFLIIFQISLPNSLNAFCLFRKTASSFTSGMWWEQIFVFSIVATYVSVNCSKCGPLSKQISGRKKLVKSLHLCINFATKPLAVYAYEKWLHKMRNDESVILHLVLRSYTADFSESEGLLSGKKHRSIWRARLITTKKKISSVFDGSR